MEALGRSLDQKQCLCLLDACWPDSGATCQWAQADGATDTETSKRDSTVCGARIQSDTLMTILGACTFHCVPQHVYSSERFGFVLLFVVNVPLRLWFERSTFCLGSIQDEESHPPHHPWFRDCNSSITIRQSRKGPSRPCAVR